MMNGVKLLPGPPLCGFHGIFEADFGCPDTPKPYPRVTPSTMSGALLPFPCPGCGRPVNFSDPAEREKYRDPARGHSWCPGCGSRFFLDERGTPLAETLPAGARAAPARVEFDQRIGHPVGKVATIADGGLEVLGDRA